MSLRSAVVLALLLAPSLVHAQRRRMGEADVNWNTVAAKKAPPVLTVKDVQEMNPLHLLVDKKKDLKLTEAQVASLKAAEATLAEKNAPHLATIDSLGQVARPKSASQSTEDEARMLLAREAIRESVQTVLGHNREAGEAAVATLEAAQQEVARTLLARQQEQTMKTLREKGAAGGRGPGGGRPPGGA